MAYQIPRNNNNMQDYHSGQYQRQNVLDVLKICTDNLTIWIFIIVLALLLSKTKSDKIFMSTSEKKKNRKLVPKATLLPLPVRLPLVDSIYNMVKFRKDGLELIERATEQCGNLFEFPFGHLTFTLVSDPVIIQKLLSSSQLAYINKPKIYHSVFGSVFHNGLLISENEIWSTQRKMLSRSFTYKSLQNYATFMNTHAVNLTNTLVNECDNSKGIEVQRINQLINSHSLKIIAQIVMGTDNLSADESNEVAEHFDRSLNLIADKVINPWKFLWLFPKRKECNRVHKYLNNFVEKITQKYKKEYEETKLSSSSQKSIHSNTNSESENESFGVKPFRCMIEEMLCSGASNQEIHQQVATILGTGHDTTVVAIRMLILHLALNPDHQIACRGEVDNVLNKKGYRKNTYNCSDETDSFDLTMEDLYEMKYLERCILESGRITPVIPLFFRRIDAPLKIDDGLEFPAGTNFAVANWTMHRDPRIYPDPLKFDPDRFLAENVKKRHPYSYTAFSLGPRNCIGSKVAIMQIKVIMSYILHYFEVFSDDKLENVKMHFGVTLLPERDHRIVLKRREKLNL